MLVKLSKLPVTDVLTFQHVRRWDAFVHVAVGGNGISSHFVVASIVVISKHVLDRWTSPTLSNVLRPCVDVPPTSHLIGALAFVFCGVCVCTCILVDRYIDR